ncbi:MAG: acetylxylan esterase [Verrucomicrobiota bacterium]
MKSFWSRHLPFCLLSAALMLSSLNLQSADHWPEAAKLPPQTGWPDPLRMFDGSRVATKEDWEKKRRPELKQLFQHYMYGQIPPKPQKVDFQTQIVDKKFLNGKATLKLVTISFGVPAPRIDLMLIVPNQTGPAPVFLAMNFCGNHALLDDPRIPLTRGWLYSSCKGCVDNRATAAARGAQSADWPIGEIIERGYALASFCSTDVDSDRADVSDGVHAWLAQQRSGSTANAPTHHRGCIAGWAWGFHRCIDYLVTDADLDSKRIAAVGHSRNGKTALLAAAFDERIALAIPHQAGCGGTAPSRGKIGESVKQINDRFPHWFNAEFKKFNETPERLPFDQHCLVALCAPRPVLLSNAIEDQWANPSGQFEVLRAAEPVYQFLGAGELGAREMPELGKLMQTPLGYYIRAGKHSMTADDWRIFLQFADRHFRKGL